MPRMIQSWHLRRRRLDSRVDRRYLGVRGVAHLHMQAQIFLAGNVQQGFHLDLILTPARLLPDSQAVRPDDDSGGRAALTTAVDNGVVFIDGEQCPTVKIANVAEADLVAAGFTEPYQLEGDLTGLHATLPVGFLGALRHVVFGNYVDTEQGRQVIIIPTGPSTDSRIRVFMPVAEAEGMLNLGEVEVAEVGADDPPLAPPDPPPPPPPVPPDIPQGVPVQHGNVRVHWADQGGPHVAQHPQGAPGPPGPGPPPVHPQGNPQDAPQVERVARPWHVRDQETPHCDVLFARASPDMLVDLASLDQFVAALAPPAGAPTDAFLPPESTLARFDYIEEEVARLVGVSVGVSELGPLQAVPAVQAAGWDAIYSSLRVVKQRARAAANAAALVPPLPSIDPHRDASWGRMADRHRQAQGVSAADTLDPSAASALQAAGVAIDTEGFAAASAPQPFWDAVAAATRVDSSASLASVRDLGSRMAAFPPELQIIEAADGSNFAATSSAHMTQIALALKTLTVRFLDDSSGRVQSEIGIEDTLMISPERVAAIKGSIKDLFRGKPLKVSELSLSGRGEDSIVHALKDTRSCDRWAVVMDWMDFVVQTFDSAASGDAGFFGKAKRLLREKHERDGTPFAVLSQFLDHRLRAIQEAFRRFYLGQLLVRPRYTADWLTNAEAVQIFESVKQQRLNLMLAKAEERDAAATAAGASAAQPAAAAGVASPSKSAARKEKKERKRKRQEAAAAAPPSAAGAPASAGAASSSTPIVLADVIGTRHTGAATGEQMAAFSAANVDAQGNGLCFNRWKRGMCRKGADCGFSHEPKA